MFSPKKVGCVHADGILTHKLSPYPFNNNRKVKGQRNTHWVLTRDKTMVRGVVFGRFGSYFGVSKGGKFDRNRQYINVFLPSDALKHAIAVLMQN